MSDFNSSLPIRTENAGDVIAKIADATIPSQQLKVNADGSIDTNFASSAKIKVWDGTDELAINADGSINTTISATDLDIRDLVFATDKVDVSGSSVDVTATNLDIRDLTHATDSVKVGDGTDFLSINSDGSINVKIMDASPDTASVDYDTAASVAAGSSSTHTYTSTGNFYLEQVEASASGKLKIEIKVNSVTKAVLFNSTANPNISLVLKQPVLATTGQTVTVIRTNKDNQAQDLYSTIVGYTQ